MYHAKTSICSKSLQLKMGGTSIVILQCPVSWIRNTVRSSIQCELKGRNIFLALFNRLLKDPEIYPYSVACARDLAGNSFDSRPLPTRWSRFSWLQHDKVTRGWEQQWPPCTRVLDSSIDPLIISSMRKDFAWLHVKKCTYQGPKGRNECAWHG